MPRKQVPNPQSIIPLTLLTTLMRFIVAHQPAFHQEWTSRRAVALLFDESVTFARYTVTQSYPFLLYPSFMTVATHLTLNEREQRVKKTSDPVERTCFLAVYHATQGRTATAIATTTVPSTRWVQQVVRRDNQEGPAALKDRRHTTPGQQRPTLPFEEQQRVLEPVMNFEP